MKSLKYLYIILICFLSITCFCNAMDELFITELCLSSASKDSVSWVELKSSSDKKINLNGWKLYNSKSLLYTFKDNENIKPCGFFLIIFYEKNSDLNNFIERNSITDSYVSVQQAKPFSQELPLDTKITTKTIKYLKGNANSKHEFDYILCNELVDQAKKDPFFFSKRENIANEILKKNNLPKKMKNVLLVYYLLSPLYSDELVLFDKDNRLASYIAWGKASNTKNYKKAVKAGLWNYTKSVQVYLDRKNPYVYLHRFGDYKSSPMISETSFEISPGYAQNRKPFSEIKLNTTSDVKYDKEKEWIFQIDFAPLSALIPTKWGYYFQIAADKQFKKPLFQQNEKVKSQTRTTRLYFKLTKKQFEKLLWNPELYYRIRRILPDGYKTEWAGGECGKMMQQAYKNNIDYKAAKAEEKVWDEAGALEKERDELRKKNDELRKSLKRTNNKKKIADLNKEIEKNEKQIEDLNKKIKDCYKRIRAF